MITEKMLRAESERDALRKQIDDVREWRRMMKEINMPILDDILNKKASG